MPRLNSKVVVASCRYASPEALFAREYASLSRALALLTGNAEVAEDAAQDAFAQLCRNWDKISGYEDQAAWVRRVAINRAVDHRRSLRRRAALLLRLSEQGSRSTRAELPNTELARAVRRLPLKQRTAVASTTWPISRLWRWRRPWEYPRVR